MVQGASLPGTNDSEAIPPKIEVSGKSNQFICKNHLNASFEVVLVRPTGFEPATCRVGVLNFKNIEMLKSLSHSGLKGIA